MVANPGTLQQNLHQHKSLKNHNINIWDQFALPIVGMSQNKQECVESKARTGGVHEGLFSCLYQSVIKKKTQIYQLHPSLQSTFLHFECLNSEKFRTAGQN